MTLKILPIMYFLDISDIMFLIKCLKLPNNSFILITLLVLHQEIHVKVQVTSVGSNALHNIITFVVTK